MKNVVKRSTRTVLSVLIAIMVMFSITVIPALAASGVGQGLLDSTKLNAGSNNEKLLSSAINDGTFINNPVLMTMLTTDVNLASGHGSDYINYTDGTAQVKYYMKSGTTVAQLATAFTSGVSTGPKGSGTSGYTNIGLEPDTENAMGFLQGFIPYINTLLGGVVILIFILLAIFTATDILYIAFPIFRNWCDEQGASGGGAVTKTDSTGKKQFRWVTDEARWAVQNCNIDQGKSPLTAYFTKRMFSYIAVSVILFILLTGNIDLITNMALKIVSYIIDVIRKLG